MSEIYSATNDDKESVVFTIFIYGLIIFTTFYFFLSLGKYKILGDAVDPQNFMEVNHYKDFLSFLMLHYTILIYTIISTIITIFAYTKYKHYISTKLEVFVFGHSVMVQLLTALSLFLGIYTSVTSASILSWLSPKAEQIGEAIYGIEYIAFLIVIVFISLVKYGIVTFKLAEKEKIEHRAHVSDIELKQTERVDELEKVIRLAPPGKFPSQFAHYADVLEDFATEKVLNTTTTFVSLSKEDKTLAKWEKTIEEQQNYIRASLIAFARLAGTYDNAALGASSALEYRANLMFKIKDPDLLNVFKSEFDYKSKFFIGLESTPIFNLVLSKEYSVLVDNEDESLTSNSNTPEYTTKKFNCDKEVKDIMLPVYLDLAGNNTVYNMFGAPEAIATCHPKFISDTLKSTDELKNKGMPKPLIDEALEYYSQDKKGRSIVSLPISNQRFLQASLKPESMGGVINIYRNKENLFSDDNEKFTDFSNLTLPLQISVSRMMHFHLMTLKEKKNCVPSGK